MNNISDTTDRTQGMLAAHIYLSRIQMRRSQRLEDVSLACGILALIAVAVASFFAAYGFANSESALLFQVTTNA